jgi:hypothetical protein
MTAADPDAVAARPIGAPRRRRRPSGEPAPLPRGALSTSGRAWLFLAIVLLLGAAVWLIPPVAAVLTGVDDAVLRAVDGLRTDTLTPVMRSLQLLGSGWIIRPVLWVTIIVLVVFRRWRHLFALLISFALFDGVLDAIVLLIGRERPVGVEILGAWQGFSHPSKPVGLLAFSMVAVTYTLAPHGSARNRVKRLIVLPIAALVVARLYLAVDCPTAVAAAVVLGVTTPLVAFRVFVPNELFPVVYRRGRAAHLTIDDRRLQAIRSALHDQLGMAAREVAPFNLTESFGVASQLWCKKRHRARAPER